MSREIRHLLMNDKVSNENKLAILRFVAHVGTVEGRSMARQSFYVQRLEKLATLLGKDFVDATEDNIRAVVAKLNTMKVRLTRKKDGKIVVSEKPIAEWTKEGYKVALKRFFRWLRNKRKRQNPEETDWIEVKKIKTKIKPSDLLSPDEVLLLLRARRAQHPRNRALILLLFETGGRPIEVLNLRIQDVSFDRYGAKVTLCGKNIQGERTPRPLRLIYSAQALANWISMHPGRENHNAPLFVSLSAPNALEPLSYDRTRLLLRLIAAEQGVTKRVNMYNFRHSILTRMACSKQLSDAEMKEFGGWSQSTQMFATYIHVSNEELDRRILQINGIIPSEQNVGLFQKTACPRCMTIYPADIDFCSNCGMALESEAAVDAEQIRNKADELLSRLLTDPRVQRYLLRKIRELKLIPQLLQLAPSAEESVEEEPP